MGLVPMTTWPSLRAALQSQPTLAKSLTHADMESNRSPSRLQGPAGEGGYPENPAPQTQEGEHNVAKTSPGEYVNQVRNEARKVVWPTRKETITTAIMVLIMTTLLAIFFLGVDAFFATIVKFLLGLLG